MRLFRKPCTMAAKSTNLMANSNTLNMKYNVLNPNNIDSALYHQ